MKSLSLQIKVPLLIVAVTLLVAGATDALVLSELDRASIRQIEQTALALGSIVQADLEYHMAEGEPRLVQRAITIVMRMPDAKNVVVFGKKGNIIASRREWDVGSVENRPSVTRAALSGETVTSVEDREGRRTVAVVFPVLNRAECAGCHSQGERILGAIQVDLDAAAHDSHIANQMLTMGMLGGTGFLLVGGILTLTLRRMILNPLSRLSESAKKLSHGDYTARVEAATRDEVGSLAHAFNDMAFQVETHTRELDDWTTQLEEKVLLRTRELSALNAVIAAASKSLDLSETLSGAMDEVLLFTGADAASVYLFQEGRYPPPPVWRGLPHDGGERLHELKLDYPSRASGLPQQAIRMHQPESGGGQLTGPTGDTEESSPSGVPILFKGEALGSLHLFSRQRRPFGDGENRLVAEMADAIGAGVKNAQITGRLRDANQEISCLLQRAMAGGSDVRFDNPYLVQCWAETGCERTDCSAYQSENRRCWQVAGTFCPDGTQGDYAKKLESCTQCEVFRQSCMRDEITSIGENFNNMMFLLSSEAARRMELRQQLVQRLISAQEEERKRVARELHDQTSQSLTSLLVGLKQLEASTTLEQVKKWAEELESQAVQVLDEVHHLALELRPAELDELGLNAALRRYLKENARRFNVDIGFSVAGQKERLPAAVETALYRIVQEGVTNAVRHAAPRTIRVSLNVRESVVYASIEDDGKGFDAHRRRGTTSQDKHLGLLGMRERTAVLGGSCSVTSEPGKGTAITAEIPLGPRDTVSDAHQ